MGGFRSFLAWWTGGASSSTAVPIVGVHSESFQIGFTGPQAQDIGATIGFVRNQIGFTGPVSQQVSR